MLAEDTQFTEPFQPVAILFAIFFFHVDPGFLPVTHVDQVYDRRPDNARDNTAVLCDKVYVLEQMANKSKSLTDRLRCFM